MMRRPRELGTFLIFAGLGLAARLPFFGMYRRIGMDCDGASYLELARWIRHGKGFVTDAHRFLFLDPAGFPHVDAHWSPLYPLLNALSFALFGESHAAAKLVPLLFGALVPALIYLFALRVTENRAAALVTAALAVVHPTLVTWSLRIETEILTVAFVVLVLTLALSIERRIGAVALGLSMGFALLLKTQSVALAPAIVLALVLRFPVRRGLVLAAIAAGVSLAVISPWLIRNTILFGNPLATDLDFNLLSYYNEFGGEPRFLSSLTAPPEPIGYMLTHPGEVWTHVRGSLHYLEGELDRARVATPLATALAVFGLFVTRTRWRAWAPLALYAATLIAAFAITVPQARYLMSIVPIGLTAAGAGVAWLFELRRASAGWRRVAAPALAIACLVGALALEIGQTLAIALDRKSEWNPAAAFCGLETEAAARWVEAHLAPREPVLASEVYHAAYVYRRPSIQIPFDDSTLAVMRDRFGAHTMIISVRELRRRLPAWETATPPWAHLVARFSPAEITEHSEAPWYRQVTEVLIYRLDSPGSPARYRSGY